MQGAATDGCQGHGAPAAARSEARGLARALLVQYLQAFHGAFQTRAVCQ